MFDVGLIIAVVAVTVALLYIVRYDASFTSTSLHWFSPRWRRSVNHWPHWIVVKLNFEIFPFILVGRGSVRTRSGKHVEADVW